MACAQQTLEQTRTALGSVGLLIATPAAGGAVGVAWGASLPTREAVRHGTVVVTTPFWHVLVFTTLGSAIGIATVLAAVALWVTVSYYRMGDPVWKAEWNVGVSGCSFECGAASLPS
jgi:hypothetical protein